MAARVTRLLEGSRTAQANGDEQALIRFRDEGAQLCVELAPLAERGDLQAGEMLFEVAQLNLLHQMASQNWITASGACTLLGGAVGAITHGISQNVYADPQRRLHDLLIRMRNVAECAACAAHQSGILMGAVMTLEVQTGIIFDILMNKTAGRAVQRRVDAGLVDVQRLVGRGQKFVEPWLKETLRTSPESINREAESAALASLSTSDHDDPLEQFYFAPHFAHTVQAARVTGRTILYVVPGFARYDGVAIRVNPNSSTGKLAESTWLPGLQSEAVDTRLQQIRSAFRTSDGSWETMSGPVQEILDWTGKHVWDVVTARWPDLLSRPVAVVPASRAALLPLYTATLHGEPACTLLDLTLAPSSRALHFAALEMTPPAKADAFVAADAWHGGNALQNVDREARTIAALYGTEPVLYGTPAAAAARPNLGAVQRLRTATVAHLACHGRVEGDNLALLLGGMVSLDQVLSINDSLLLGRPLVVLSACELAGFTGENISAEQYGFPAGLLAIGARAVVGALWPVPDSRAMVWTMESFHQYLDGLPSGAALPEAIRQARRRDKRALVWASLAHFGA